MLVKEYLLYAVGSRAIILCQDGNCVTLSDTTMGERGGLASSYRK